MSYALSDIGGALFIEVTSPLQPAELSAIKDGLTTRQRTRPMRHYWKSSRRRGKSTNGSFSNLSVKR